MQTSSLLLYSLIKIIFYTIERLFKLHIVEILCISYFINYYHYLETVEVSLKTKHNIREKLVAIHFH